MTIRNAATTRHALTSALTVPKLSRRASLLLAAAWLATSLCLCLAVFWSFRRLARERKNWKRMTLHDTQVLVSDGFGPALVGLMRPEIVVPPWVLTLDAAAARTILAHEIEHRRAGDSRLIAIAMLLSIAMPWNPILWWMTGRLVRAVEFDCDARVVAHGINTVTYADVLLGAWQHGMTNRRIAFSAAFAERRSRLGQRVNHLLRPEPRGKIMKTLSGATIVVLLAALAVAAPTPQIAQAVATPAPKSLQPMGPVHMLVIDGVARTDLNSEEERGAEWRSRSGAAEFVIASWLDSVNARRLFGNLGAHGADVWWTKGYVDRVGPQLPVGQMLADRLLALIRETHSYDVQLDAKSLEELARRVTTRLMSGLDVTSAQRLEADRIVLQYVIALHAGRRQPPLVREPTEIAITNSRDSALRIVLTDETQPAKFNQIVAEERRFLVATGVREMADMMVRGSYFSDNVPVSDREIAAAITVIERSLVEEAALFTRTPYDTAALKAVKVKRTADVRRVLDSDAKRAAFDFKLRLWRRVGVDL